jgi:hypothetical protein
MQSETCFNIKTHKKLKNPLIKPRNKQESKLRVVKIANFNKLWKYLLEICNRVTLFHVKKGKTDIRVSTFYY